MKGNLYILEISPSFSTEAMILGGRVYQHEVPDFHQHPGVWLRICGKAAGCHSLHHPSWPQANPQLKDLVLVSLGRLLGRFPKWSLSYWIEILKKVKHHNLQYIHLPPRKHESRCIYIYYIYIYFHDTSTKFIHRSMIHNVTKRHFTPHLKPPLGTLETCSACELTNGGDLCDMQEAVWGVVWFEKWNNLFIGILCKNSHYDLRSGGFFFVGKWLRV